jgi:hypothetical protein
MGVTPQPLPEHHVPRHHDQARARNFGDRFVVAVGDRTVELDGVGAFIFRSVDGDADVGRIARRVAEEYGIAYPQALADCGEFLAELHACGLLGPT